MALVPTSWRKATGTLDRWSIRATGGGLPASGGVAQLMQWGPSIQFLVQPLNFHEMDHETETDWAKKEIAGAAIYREWVGENDEVIHLRGKLFPYRVGGMSEIETFDSQRRAGLAESADPRRRGEDRLVRVREVGAQPHLDFVRGRRPANSVRGDLRARAGARPERLFADVVAGRGAAERVVSSK